MKKPLMIQWLKSLLWSWRDLNPRPNRQLKCFLHAYPFIENSVLNREKATQSCTYPSKVFIAAPRYYSAYPDIWRCFIGDTIGLSFSGKQHEPNLSD